LKVAKLRPQAEQDLIEAARYYQEAGSPALAERMFDAAIAALDPIQGRPALGSLRLGQICEIPGLRSWRITGFPMQWFYFERQKHLDVIRLLGDRQDILSILGVAGSEPI
jgi:toxin ParE1/3/4